MPIHTRRVDRQRLNAAVSNAVAGKKTLVVVRGRGKDDWNKLLGGKSRIVGFGHAKTPGARPAKFLAVDLSGLGSASLDASSIIKKAREHGAAAIVLRDESGRAPRRNARVQRLISDLRGSGIPVVLQTSARTTPAKFRSLIQGAAKPASTFQAAKTGKRRAIRAKLMAELTIQSGADGRLVVGGPPLPPDESGDRGRDGDGEPSHGGDDGGSSPVRHVNTLVAPKGADVSVDVNRPLATDSDYEILLNIGPAVAGSLLPEPDGQWPADKLPGGGLRLHAVLNAPGQSEPMVCSLSLPEKGTSFTCQCPPDKPHTARCTRERWVRFPLHTPAESAVLTMELVIYYEVFAVHAQELILAVGTGSGPISRILTRQTRAFDDLTWLSSRTASFVVASESGRVLVNGVRFADNPFSIETNAQDTSGLAVRETLYHMHFTVTKDSKEINKYSTTHSKPRREFEEDLRNLAALGRRLYDSVFGPRREHPWSLSELLRNEAKMRNRPPILSMIEPTGAADRIPWAFLYDIPIDPHSPADYQLCPSVRMFGPDSTVVDVPASCPESDHLDESEDVLCPFGFWGLSYIIEVPPSTDGNARHVVTTEQSPITIEIAADPGLDEPLRTQHVNNLRDIAKPVGATIDAATVKTGKKLAAALAGDTMDIAYLYCHGAYDSASTHTTADACLCYGDSIVGPSTISSWAAKPKVWPKAHWEHRAPLIVLNGCHTTEMSSKMLSSFVPVFTRVARAAGVLGTETAIDQRVANWAMELFVSDLLEGRSVGTALRSIRWRMLARGNVMGLGYTPHCLSTLTMRSSS